MDIRDAEDSYNGTVDADSRGSARPTSRSGTGPQWSPTERAARQGACVMLHSKQQLQSMPSGHATGQYAVQISRNGLLLGADTRNLEAAAAAQRKPAPTQLQLSNGQQQEQLGLQRAGNAVRVTDLATVNFRTAAEGAETRLEGDPGRDSHRAQPLALDLNLSSTSTRNARALSHAEQLATKEWALGIRPAVSRFRPARARLDNTCLSHSIRAKHYLGSKCMHGSNELYRNLRYGAAVGYLRVHTCACLVVCLGLDGGTTRRLTGCCCLFAVHACLPVTHATTSPQIT